MLSSSLPVCQSRSNLRHEFLLLKYAGGRLKHIEDCRLMQTTATDRKVDGTGFFDIKSKMKGG